MHDMKIVQLFYQSMFVLIREKSKLKSIWRNIALGGFLPNPMKFVYSYIVEMQQKLEM